METTQYKFIGEGSFGQVYLSNQNTAIKVFNLDDYDYDYDYDYNRELITNEIRIVKNLTHPNLPKYINSWEDKDNIYLETNYGGINLNTFVKQFPDKKVPIHIFNMIMKQIINGICYLHSQLIVHGDIKMDNILIDNNNIMIVDFGLSEEESKLIERIHSNDYEYVTMFNRPPELLLQCGDDLFSSKIDVWSLGCVWYHLLNGNYPFFGDSDIDQIYKIFQIFGTPTIHEFPDLYKCKKYKNYQLWPKWAKIASELTTNPIYKSIFVYDPRKRISCKKLSQFL